MHEHEREERRDVDFLEKKSVNDCSTLAGLEPTRDKPN
jgi:hypothetical protein